MCHRYLQIYICVTRVLQSLRSLLECEPTDLRMSCIVHVYSAQTYMYINSVVFHCVTY